MTEPNKTPAVDQSLVDWLARVYPNQCPRVTDAEREIWIAVGAQMVIGTLRHIAKQQQLTVL